MESYLPYSSATPPGCILITTGHPSPLIIAGVRCLAPGTGDPVAVCAPVYAMLN